MSVHHVEVRLHGDRVGELVLDRGGSEFSYEGSPSSPGHRVLGQIFEDDPASRRRARVGLPAWFENLLPEGALRRQIIADLGGGNVSSQRILLRLGDSLPGAVTIHPAHELSLDADEDPASDLDEDEEEDRPLRHSLAGVQLKFSIAAHRLTTVASGQGSWWIVKLPDPSLPHLPVNEWLTMTWQERAGFDVPTVRLVPASQVKGIPAGLCAPDDLLYLIDRFDRSPTGPVHVEDFAQIADVFPRDKYGRDKISYDTLASVVLTLAGEDDYLRLVDRLVAMLVVGNTDAHLKNWALTYPDGRAARLSPVYDVHSLSVYQTYARTPLALRLGGEERPLLISSDHFRRLAETAGADPEKTVARAGEALTRLREAWFKGMADEASARFPALRDHYDDRLTVFGLDG